jgi:outer membrane protease
MMALLSITASLGAEPAPAQEVSLTVAAGAGIMYGTAKEFAREGTFAISELDWAMQPLFFVENSLELRALGGLHASLKVRSGLPMQSGIISDSDWLNYAYNGDTNKTNFSQSNCFTERAILVDVSIGWEFQLGSGFSFEPFTSFGYMSWEWTARDGYLQYPAGWFSSTPPSPPYPDWSPSQPQIPIYGTGIIYSQTYWIPAIGFRLGYRPAEKWRLAFSLAISPYVYCIDKDVHIFTGAEYTDTMGGGWMIEPELSTELHISERAVLSAGASYRHIAGLVGDDSQTFTGADYSGAPAPTPGTQHVFSNGGGASYDALSAWLTFSFGL